MLDNPALYPECMWQTTVCSTSADEGSKSKYKQEGWTFRGLRIRLTSELITAIESGEGKTAPDEKKTAIAAKLLSRSTRISIATGMRDYDADGKRTELSVYTQRRPGISTLHVSSRGSFPQNENKESLWTECIQTNVGMKVGDTIKVNGKEFEVSGLIAYVNSPLHEGRPI